MKRWIVLALMALALPIAAFGQTAVYDTYGTAIFTTSSSTPAQCFGQSSAWFHETSSGSTGPVNAFGSNDGASWTPTSIFNAAGASVASPVTPTAGVDYKISPANFKYIEISPDASWSGQTATIFVRCTSAPDTINAASGGSSVTQGTSPWVVSFPSSAPWPTTSPNGVPLLTYTKPLSVHLTSSSTTGCNNISASPGVLYEIANVSTTQTVGIDLYDDAGATCAAANEITDPILGNTQVIFFGPFGHGLANGLAYKIVTASLTGGGVQIDYSKQQL